MTEEKNCAYHMKREVKEKPENAVLCNFFHELFDLFDISSAVDHR